jgi:hypothetical protein
VGDGLGRVECLPTPYSHHGVRAPVPGEPGDPIDLPRGALAAEAYVKGIGYTAQGAFHHLSDRRIPQYQGFPGA